MGFAPPLIDVIASLFSLNVAVTDWPVFPIEKLQVLPVHPVTPADWTLQPTNTEPVLAVAVIVPTSLLPRATGQGFGEPVQEVLSPGVVVSETTTEPAPFPAKVIVRFLLSLNVFCACACEPTAVR